MDKNNNKTYRNLQFFFLRYNIFDSIQFVFYFNYWIFYFLIIILFMNFRFTGVRWIVYDICKEWLSKIIYTFIINYINNTLITEIEMTDKELFLVP